MFACHFDEGITMNVGFSVQQRFAGSSVWRGCVAMAVTMTMLVSASAQEAKFALQQSLEDTNVGDRWSYNDWDSAKAAAAKSKKPILALFR